MAQSGSDLRLIGPPTAGAATNDSGDQALLENFNAHNKIRTGVIFAEVNHELNVGRKTLGATIRPACGRTCDCCWSGSCTLANCRPTTGLNCRADRSHNQIGRHAAWPRKKMRSPINRSQRPPPRNRPASKTMWKRGQERVKQLIERFNSLLREGRYAEAEDLALPKRSRPRPILRRLMPRHSNRG